ncbi:hypothetical protein HAP94_20230 [Acidithiobacillus ferrivorans]|nr:hypothetical protein [Acidithiobacillus ferrivorans]
MFYFYDPLMNIVQAQSTPPAITRVVEAPVSPPTLPKGWQWAKTGRGDPMKEGHVGRGKERGFHFPATPSPIPSGIVAACPPVSEPIMGTVPAPQVVPAPVAAAALPTWSVVSWKNLAPRSITGTRKEAVALVENDLSMAGIHHLDVHVYDAIHVIVALQR